MVLGTCLIILFEQIQIVIILGKNKQFTGTLSISFVVESPLPFLLLPVCGLEFSLLFTTVTIVT